MKKQDAIELLGKTAADVAVAVGTSYQAVHRWPDDLPPRIADRVIAACVRQNIDIPEKFLKTDAADPKQEDSHV